MSTIFPLELLDKCIGQKVWILMKEEKELVGVLRGFDDFLNMVIDDAVSYEYLNDKKIQTNIDSILLNGTHVLVLVPGGEPL